MEKRLHIVCLDTPYPVDCKSAFIMFHEIKALHEKGARITLHCFEYSRPGNDVINQYCDQVHYYPKQKGHKGFSFSLPYTVSSRANEQLVKNLQADDYPVLVHGVQSTFFLTRFTVPGRKILVRLHCAQHSLCNSLASIESSFLNKLYYQHESRLLKCYEKNLSSKAVFAALTEETKNNYQQELGYENIVAVPVIIPWNEVEAKEGTGSFCLYHGNLSMPENEKSAIWLLENVFNKLNIPFVIAGKSPSSYLENAAHLRANSCLIANPSENEMQDLIRKAHINVLPSFYAESCNIKLLNALFCGRHCVVNEKMAGDPELRPLLHIAENAEAFRSSIVRLMDESFDERDIRARECLLKKSFNNEENISRLMSQLWY